MKLRQRRVRVLQALRVPLPVAGGELAFTRGQVALVDPRAAGVGTSIFDGPAVWPTVLKPVGQLVGCPCPASRKTAQKGLVPGG